MKKKKMSTKILLPFILIVLIALLLIITTYANSPKALPQNQQGQIYLYGETHSNSAILEKELELWCNYYNEQQIRHLFVELPYYTAQFLNLWMQSDNDDILEQLYLDWDGTAIHSEEVFQFYKQIKQLCPETIFHGTDIGHQYNTTGQRYIKYLEANQLQDTVSYELATENIRQGEKYYKKNNNIYRENTMTKNFIREFDTLVDASVMGIYGSAHTSIAGKEYSTGLIPCMANQLHKRYKTNLYSEDLSSLARNIEPLGTETITINDKKYDATYYGKVDLSTVLPDFQCREFWRIENAYEEFKEFPTTANVLPYNNYPMAIETGQIYVIKYTKTDGTIHTEYHRSDGNTWQGSTVTNEFILK